MTEVVIRNKGLLEQLDGFIEEYFAIDGYDNLENRLHSTQQALDNPEYFCGDEYLQLQLAKGDAHSGFPEEHMAYPISTAVRNHPDKFTTYRDKVKREFAQELGAHSSALLNYYPPGGFVGWHTNWNSNAYQVLFTWSRTGDGYFKYRDPQTHEIVTIQDVPGWQCRHYYFGRRDEPDYHCWHAAYAGCDRITLAYKYENQHKGHRNDALAQEMRDVMLADITEE